MKLFCVLLLAALSAPAATFYVTISGLGGEPDYEQRFKMWAEDIGSSLKRAGGDANVVTLQAPTRDQIRARFAEIAKQAKPADALVVEVGLGGKYDATNIVARPRLTVITPVGLDHTEFLGTSLADIAAEKAGIIKSGVPLIVGPQDDAPLDVILRRADALGAPALVFGQDFFAHQEHGRMVYQDHDGLLDLPLPG